MSNEGEKKFKVGSPIIHSLPIHKNWVGKKFSFGFTYSIKYIGAPNPLFFRVIGAKNSFLDLPLKLPRQPSHSLESRVYLAKGIEFQSLFCGLFYSSAKSIQLKLVPFKRKFSLKFNVQNS